MYNMLLSKTFCVLVYHIFPIKKYIGNWTHWQLIYILIMIVLRFISLDIFVHWKTDIHGILHHYEFIFYNYIFSVHLLILAFQKCMAPILCLIHACNKIAFSIITHGTSDIIGKILNFVF